MMQGLGTASVAPEPTSEPATPVRLLGLSTLTPSLKLIIFLGFHPTSEVCQACRVTGIHFALAQTVKFRRHFNWMVQERLWQAAHRQRTAGGGCTPLSTCCGCLHRLLHLLDFLLTFGTFFVLHAKGLVLYSL
jgi:hypothetical protein